MELLRKLGFTLYESRILSYMLKESRWVSAEEIVKNARVPKTKIYSLLIKLEKEGLIKATPGKPRRFLAKKEEFIARLRELKRKTFMKKLRQEEELISQLAKALPKIVEYEKVEVRYFTDPEEYWKAYLKEVNKFRKGDIYRVINTVRLTFGLLKEEIENIPSLKKYAGTEPALAKGAKLHYILNPKTIVERTIAELKDPQKVEQSLRQMLRKMYLYRKQIMIDIHPAFKNLLVVIMKDCVCFEFYDESSVSISSAIMIFGKSIVSDFSKWFDALCAKKHDPEEDIKKFEREIWKQWKKLTTERIKKNLGL